MNVSFVLSVQASKVILASSEFSKSFLLNYSVKLADGFFFQNSKRKILSSLNTKIINYVMVR